MKYLNDAKQVQENLIYLFVWCNDNNMILNIDECAIVSFSLKNKTHDMLITALIIYVCHEKKYYNDLGVSFDSSFH